MTDETQKSKTKDTGKSDPRKRTKGRKVTIINGTLGPSEYPQSALYMPKDRFSIVCEKVQIPSPTPQHNITTSPAAYNPKRRASEFFS